MPNNELLAAYPDQECPDCGEPIPDIAVEGDECINCGHVFCIPREDIDER